MEQPSIGGYDDTMPIEWYTLDVANNFRIPTETFQIYSYNGYEFGAPAIDADSDCKYHIIHKYENGYYYTCTNKPFMYTEDNNKYAEIKESLKRIVYVCRGDDIGFVHNYDLADSGLRVLWDNIIWTNTDISDADGTVRMAATEPVYVREQVIQELIKVSNYIPTDEMVNNHAISIQSDGDEVVLSSPNAALLDDEGNIVMVSFLDLGVGLAVFMYYFKQEIIAEGQAVVEPGLYYADSIPSMYPPDTKFKFYIPDEM